MPTRLIPLVEWAAREGYAFPTARRMAAEGRIPAKKVSARWFVVEEVPEPPADAERKGKVFTFFTHAGGAGKTSLARDLGYELTTRGYRVLLVDMDPQANLSAWLGHDQVDPKETALPLFEGGDLPPPKEVMAGLYLIPSHVELARAEVLLSQGIHKGMALRGALNALRNQYDYILIDSLPSLGALAATAALAADGLLVPVELSQKGLQALSTVLDIGREYGKALLRMGLWSGTRFVVAVFPNYAEGTVRDREALGTLNHTVMEMRIPVAPARTRRPALHREAQATCVPIHLVADNKEVLEEIRRIADAFLTATKEEVALTGEVA